MKPGEMTGNPRTLGKVWKTYGQFFQTSLGMKGQNNGRICIYVSMSIVCMDLCIYVCVQYRI